MKKLLSLIGATSITTSAVAPLVANTKYQPNTTDQSALSYTKQQIKNDELPIPNINNWDLSTGAGYFAYFWYCLSCLKGNIFEEKTYAANYRNEKDGDYIWDDNLQEGYLQEKCIVNIREITNISEIELDHSHDVLTNNSDIEQDLSTSSYSRQQTVGHSLTLGAKISTTFDITAYVLDTKISAEISASDTWTDTVTDTYNAPSQKVNVPAHSEIDVDYYFYKTVDQVDTWLYKKYDTYQLIYIVWPPEYFRDVVVEPSFAVLYYVYELIDGIKKFENTDWIFNIPNGYLQEKDGDYYIKSTMPISYENDGTKFEVVCGSAKPI
uniref:Putative transmembrane protein n=1 Tax=Spiroplasma citri TaxID=2133 RepID=Q3ZVI5_SPICI|nr:ETX/MTX2 family pore-forming toxin [Spiroplasma citri]CAI94303.1 putative transmembrane protein [Spiroplasma citri]